MESPLNNRKVELIQGTNVETLGIQGSELAQLVDLQNPPVQIPLERIEDYKTYFLTEFGNQTQLDTILGNIRFIDKDTTSKSLRLLAEAISTRFNKDNTILVSDNEVKKSRIWICNQLAEMNHFAIKKEGELTKSDASKTLILADDIMIAGEQSAHLMERISEKLGIKPKFVEAYIAGTDNFRSGARGNISQGQEVLRVFKVQTLDEVLTGRIPGWASGGEILTFLDHKVPDNFLGILTRYNAIRNKGKDGKYKWLVDDLSVAPPYYPNKFTDPNSGWSNRAQLIPR